MTESRVLILGATGMLGHALFFQLHKEQCLEVYGTVRNHHDIGRFFSLQQQERIQGGVDADNFDSIVRAVAAVRPDTVINCIGLIKQLPEANDPLVAIPLNAMLPHRLALLCKAAGSRLIHFSTDCVFDGIKGAYVEADSTSALDLYGRTKALGELEYPHCLTIRTSIVGHELKGKFGLVDWFLSQSDKVRGFTRAIYSGFPTVELCRIICEFVLPHPELKGIIHVSSSPISKYDLLMLVAETYGKEISIEPYDDFVVDRSLDSSSFTRNTGYQSPPWPELVAAMYRHYMESSLYQENICGDML